MILGAVWMAVANAAVILAARSTLRRVRTGRPSADLVLFLLLRFAFKLFGANSQQPLIAALYGATEPLVRPFQGIFPEPQGPPVLDIAALLAIVFLFLVALLIVALVRAITNPKRV